MKIYNHFWSLRRIVPILLLLCIFNAQAFAAATANITANGLNAPLSLNDDEAIAINISLDQGDASGVDADWWVLAKTPFGWYHYNLGGSWKPGLLVTHQGPIKSLSNYQVLSSSLPPGDYTFYFGVDTVRNGQPDMDSLYYDTVDVTFISTQTIDPMIGTWDVSNGVVVSINNLVQSVGGDDYYSGTVYWPTFSNGALMITGSPYTDNIIKVNHYDISGERIKNMIIIDASETIGFENLTQMRIDFNILFDDSGLENGNLLGKISYMHLASITSGVQSYNAPVTMTRR